MQYTQFGRTGAEVSKLGFGCMRLPTRMAGGRREFDDDEGVRIIRRAVELGVNYFDTAPGYCDARSEIILGKALKGLRDKVFVSTKNPLENASGDDYERRLETSLQKLGMDHIDFYHFWGIDLRAFHEKAMAKDGPMARAVRKKEEGVVRHISFSFHDAPGNLSQIIRESEGRMETVLCQYNLLDQKLAEDMAFAKEQGLGVVIMGPVGGGRLGEPSPVISRIMGEKMESTAETALRFVLTNPNVDIALSGMGSMEMVEENAAVASMHSPLTPEEVARANAMLKENAELADLYCTGCEYCMPCPQDVNIPEVFRLMNYHRVYKITGYAKQQYAMIGKIPWMDYSDASACIDCGQCEEKCPQKLPIRKQLRETHAALSGA